MRGFVLQDWVTIRGASGTTVTQVIQNEANWLSLEMYQDIVFWLQVSEISLGGGTTLTLNYETAPIKDESLWVAMPAGSGVPLTASSATLTVTPKTVMALQTGTTYPLSRWVRWRLIAPSGTTSAWDITFRILLSCNQLFSPGMGGGYGGGGSGGGGGWGQQMR